MQNNKGFKKLREKDGFYLCANINFPEICKRLFCLKSSEYFKNR